MIAVEHLMLKKKLRALYKKAVDRGSPEIFSNFVIKEHEEIKNAYDNQIAQILTDGFMEQDISEELFQALNYIDDRSLPVLKYKVLKYYNQGNLEGFIEFIKEHKEIMQNEQVHRSLNDVLDSVDIEKSIHYLCVLGIYNKEKFIRYFNSYYNSDIFKNYVKEFENSGNYEDLEKILLQCIDQKNDIECYIELGNIYMRNGKKENLKKLIDKMTYLFPENPILPVYYSYLEDYQSVIKYSDITSLDNATLADAYYHTGDYENSLKIYKYIYYNEDKNVLDKIIQITYDLQDYYSLLGYINSKVKNTKLSRTFILYKIEAEINLEMYSEAESDISKYKSEFTEDMDINQLLIKYYLNVDNQEYAYKLSLSLIERGITEQWNYKIVVDYLFENRDYGSIIKLLQRGQNISEFKPEYCSSLIHTGDIDTAMRFISEDKMLLDSAPVVDTLFEFLKIKENMKKFESVDISGTLVEMIIAFLKGKENIDYNQYMEKVHISKSISCVYILATAAYNGEISIQKNYIRGLLSKDKYQTVGSILSSIYSIKIGIVPDDINDSQYFLYPITRALIENGFYEQAHQSIEAINNKSPDPFYYYIRSLLEQSESNLGEAIKHIDEAITLLNNINFIALRIDIGLQRNERVDNYVNLCIEQKLVETFIHVDDFVEKNKIEVKESFKETLEKLEVDNIGIFRLKTYCLDDYKIRIKFSALSILHGGTSEDIVKHYSLLNSKNEKLSIMFLEYYSNKKYITYIILSSYYYSKRIYKKTLEYFNRAYIRNSSATNNPIFNELVNGNIISQKIIEDMKSTNEWFDLFLYYYFRKEYDNVKEVIRTQYKNKKILEFAVNHVWETMALKELMLGIFMSTGDKILGELLAGKFHDMELYDQEVTILKILVAKYPEESMLQNKLVNAFIMDNQEGPALELSYKNYHNNKSRSTFNRMVKITYDLKDYSSLVNIFKNNAEFIADDNIEYFIYSQIKLFNYIGVRAMVKEYSGIITEQLMEKISSRIKASYRVKSVVDHAHSILKKEIELNKILTFNDMHKYLPEYLVSDVYNFITNDLPYSYIDQNEFNDQSKNIIKRLREKGISSINTIKIHDIYSVIGDVIRAKNFYIFLGRAMEGYYKYSMDLDRWAFNAGFDESEIPGLIEIMVKYDIGLLDSMAILEKIKKG